jgi:hypothetical protein
MRVKTSASAEAPKPPIEKNRGSELVIQFCELVS